jgi:hypothetical protein
MAYLEVIPYKEKYRALLDLYPPVPANRVLPKWYKKLSRGNLSKLNETYHNEKVEGLTAKQCPAIQDIMSEGFILPLWTRIDFNTRNDDGKVLYNYNIHFLNSRTLDDDLNYHLSNHDERQFEGMDINTTVDNKVLKIFCPYYFKVPKGYSLMYTDPFYHFRKDIRCLSGIVEADKWGSITFPFELLKDNFSIEAGTPLIHIFPFKRKEQLKLKISKGTEQDYYMIEKRNLEYFSSRKHYKDLT